MMSDESGVARIGLLFVHGVGEQQRWDHLKSSVQELAELLLQTEDHPRITIVDRTENWPHPPGDPDPGGLAPLTLEYTTARLGILFDCHEVWWADLGARSGIGDVITFWLWGLGQWAAPIYRELDAARLPKEDSGGKPASTLARPPDSVAGSLVAEPLARLQLVLAALAAIFVACTWSLAKRLFAALLGQVPTPTLIVRYVGDVRTYESRSAPGDSALSDPGKPRRVGIRRRMVSQMIGLATGPCEGWFVIAHSLGTVLAYNGLTETGHALPNYLTREQWARVPDAYKRDPNCQKRDGVSAMLPARPPWLVYDDVIDRQLLFSKLRGFLTYGSPLDKFASLWPRIVATATDRKNGASPFPDDCRWLNLVAPSDPVAGTLDSYDASPGSRLENAIPRVENIRMPWTPLYGLAHIRYFAGSERYNRSRLAAQKRLVAQWVLGAGNAIPDHPQNWPARFLSVQFAYPALVAALWVIATAFIVIAVDSARNLLGRHLDDWWAVLHDWWSALPAVLAAALATILLMGIYRWAMESGLNARLAAADKATDEDQSPKRLGYWNRLIRMLRLHCAAGLVLLPIAVLALLAGVLLDWGAPTSIKMALSSKWERLPFDGLPGAWLVPDHCWTVVIALAGLLIAAVVQAMVNLIIPPVGKAPG